MARPSSITIPINSDALKNIIKAKGHNLSDLGTPELLDVSRQTINTWLQLGNIPPRKLSILGQKLNLTPAELENIVNSKSSPEIKIQYRTNRNVKINNEEIQKEVLAIAQDYFFLSNTFSFNLSIKPPLKEIKSTTPELMADYILDTLQLNRNQLSLESVINALKDINIHVLFYDFGKDFTQAYAQALCVKKEDSSVIFINANEYIEDVLWRIFHELCHIFYTPQEGTEHDEEIFCNDTATETITPRSFFLKHKDQLKKIVSRNFYELPTVVGQIATKLNASFRGVILALKESGILEKNQSTYLWKIYNSKKQFQKKVSDIIIPGDNLDPFVFWKDLFNNPEYNKFLTLQELVKAGLINGTLSTERAAEILKIDSMTTQQLEQFWKDEYAGTAHN